MRKKRRIVILLFIFIYIGLVSNVSALTFDTLPVEQSSQRWSVEISEGVDDNSKQQSKFGHYDTRSLKVENMGENNLITAEISMYRNEPKSTTKYALQGCPEALDCKQISEDQKHTLAAQLNNGSPYNFTNFILAKKATELEVEITWTEKGNEGRPLKERFFFSEE